MGHQASAVAAEGRWLRRRENRHHIVGRARTPPEDVVGRRWSPGQPLEEAPPRAPNRGPSRGRPTQERPAPPDDRVDRPAISRRSPTSPPALFDESVRGGGHACSTTTRSRPLGGPCVTDARRPLARWSGRALSPKASRPTAMLHGAIGELDHIPGCGERWTDRGTPAAERSGSRAPLAASRSLCPPSAPIQGACATFSNTGGKLAIE